MGSGLKDGLREIQAEYPVIGDVRGLGLMIAAEFVKPDGAPNPDGGRQGHQRCHDEKVLLLNCGTWDQAIRIIPPLVVNEDADQRIPGCLRAGSNALQAQHE